jgi:hypothetical protein
MDVLGPLTPIRTIIIGVNDQFLLAEFFRVPFPWGFFSISEGHKKYVSLKGNGSLPGHVGRSAHAHTGYDQGDPRVHAETAFQV